MGTIHLTSAALYKLKPTWVNRYPNKEVPRKMAESTFSDNLNGGNVQNESNAVTRISVGVSEDNEKTDQGYDFMTYVKRLLSLVWRVIYKVNIVWDVCQHERLISILLFRDYFIRVLVNTNRWCMMEPLLLEEYMCRGVVPQSILNVLEFYRERNSVPDKTDIIISFIYILMLESGFVEKSSVETQLNWDFNYQKVLRHSKSLPENWKQKDSYHMDFILTSVPSTVCSLVVVNISDDILVNCRIKNLANYSYLIDPLTYFISLNTHLEAHSFQNLDHLARNFKNSIAFPAKVSIATANGGICACLLHLPHELLITIMTLLEIKDVLSLARTCRVLCQAAKDSTLWVRLLDCYYRKKKLTKTHEELICLYEIKYANQLTKLLLMGSQEK